MYLMIPAMNVYLGAASCRNLYAFVGVLLVMFTACGTFLDANVYHHVFWYATLYLVGALIRQHPFGWMLRIKVCAVLLFISVCIAILSVLCLDILAAHGILKVVLGSYFVVDSHKLFAFTTGLFLFLVFKNLRLSSSRFVNAVASTTFGVFLIHSASDGMRKLLWQDIFNVSNAYTFSLPTLVIHSVIAMILVFAVCSALDYLRIFMKRPLLAFLCRIC